MLKVDKKVSHLYFTVFFMSFCWLWYEPLNKFPQAMKHIAWDFSGFPTHNGRCGAVTVRVGHARVGRVHGVDAGLKSAARSLRVQELYPISQILAGADRV